MDPVRNPYAPGAGQLPPELAGRDEERRAFDVLLERVPRGRPARGAVLSGLRGVGKTVLLAALRSQAIRAAWGTGRLEARSGRSLRLPLATAVHAAVRELAARHRDPDRVATLLGVVQAFALHAAAGDRRGGAGTRWQPLAGVRTARGRADSGDLEVDLTDLLLDAGELATDLGVGIALFLDELQDGAPAELGALCGVFHELSQRAVPVVVVAAGLPHLPATLAASRSYAERLFRYVRVDRLDRAAADRALTRPAAEEGADFAPAALDALYEHTDGYPYFVQAFGKAVWDAAPGSPIEVADVHAAAPQATAELAVGFFGSRVERATPAERDYLRAMADLHADGGPDAVSTAEVARALGRRPQSLSPARDALIKKGLVYAAARGSVAFTVPHFGRYLRTRADAGG